MEDIIVKHYECFVPGCSWQTHAEEEAEVVRRASEHMRKAHEETTIRPNMVEQIKTHIREADNASS
jgi:predicted small metal-binding protein